MKIINDDKWWSLGDNVMKKLYTGTIADDKPLKDLIIYNEKELKIFQENLAMNIFKKVYRDKNKNDENNFEYILNKNEEDELLNTSVQFDFQKEILVVINSAKIKEIYFSKIFDCFLIILDNIQVEKNYYSLALCNKLNNSLNNNSNLKFELINEKPKSLIENRPENNNDEY